MTVDSENRHAFKEVFSFLLVILPVILIVIYLISSWIGPLDWEPNNELDGSWRYALGKLRVLGLSLGKDAFFTYGPLAHWFGPPIGGERYQPFLYYLLGIAIVIIIGVCLFQILSRSTVPYPIKLFIAFIFPLFPIGGEFTLYLTVLFTIFTGYLFFEKEIWWIVVVLILSCIGVNYKFSFGLMSSFCFWVAIAYAFSAKTIGKKGVFLFLGAYGVLVYTLFVLTSGGFDIRTYLMMGQEISVKYSEIMIRDDQFFVVRIIMVLAYISSSLLMLWFVARKMERKASIFFMISILGVQFLLFKHGFVRSDRGHILGYYYSTFPFIVIIAFSAFSSFRENTISNKVLLAMASIILVLVYGSTMSMLRIDFTMMALIEDWKSMGSGIIYGLQGQSPEEFKQKSTAVRNNHAALFSYLDKCGAKLTKEGRKPTITFYPWEVMFMEGVERFEPKPSPSIQLYATGPGSKAHQLEAAFLASKQRPSVVVIGPKTIDGRSPVSELTDLLPQLYAKYMVSSVIEGYTVFEERKSSASNTVIVQKYNKPTGSPNEFMLIKLNPTQFHDTLIRSIVTTLFKAPELSVTVSWRNLQNNLQQTTFRGYISQLEKGVFFYPGELPDFFTHVFDKSETAVGYITSEGQDNRIVEASAELFRNEGWWNFPVIQERIPLNIEYCSFKLVKNQQAI